MDAANQWVCPLVWGLPWKDGESVMIETIIDICAITTVVALTVLLVVVAVWAVRELFRGSR